MQVQDGMAPMQWKDLDNVVGQAEMLGRVAPTAEKAQEALAGSVGCGPGDVEAMKEAMEKHKASEQASLQHEEDKKPRKAKTVNADSKSASIRDRLTNNLTEQQTKGGWSLCRCSRGHAEDRGFAGVCWGNKRNAFG